MQRDQARYSRYSDNGGNGKYVTCCSCGTTTAGKPSDRPADSEPRLAARVGRS